MSSALFSPIRLAGLELANRIVVSPMCQYSADDGCANDWHLMHLGMLANSGAGLVVVEATHVERHGRITHGCLGLYSDDNEAALARVVSQRAGAAAPRSSASSSRMPAARARRSGPGKAAARSRPARGSVADDRASAIPFGDGWHTPREATEAGHRPRARRLRQFGASARCASASTRSNCTWRTAICCTASCRRCPTSAPTNTAAASRTACAFRSSVARAVRAVVPKDVPLGARITGSDWRDGGLTPDDAVAIAKALKAEGLDFICVSSGGVAPTSAIRPSPATTCRSPSASSARRASRRAPSA